MGSLRKLADRRQVRTEGKNMDKRLLNGVLAGVFLIAVFLLVGYIGGSL